MAIIDGDIASNRLHGTSDADTISGADSADRMFGRGGDDVMYGFGVADNDPESGTIQVDRIVQGLDRPIFAGSPPGRPDALFVAEQSTGQIKIVDLNTNTVLATPFLDIDDAQITHDNEQGLLGVAFDPKYETNGRFYVDLTNENGDIEIWRYKRSAGDPDIANPASKHLIMRIDHPAAHNHNGGWIDFGPDGYLYIAVGDGGGGGDPGDDGQTPNSLLGKILRIDVNGDDFAGDHSKNYAIPDDNPFVGVDGADEVWEWGLRNPWRNSFDSATGDLYVGDVGQNAHEEVDYVAAGTGAGLNFGWNRREGDFPYNGGADDSSFTDPIIDLPHDGAGLFGGSTVIGGRVYRGPGGGQGLYFFSDLGSNNFWTTRVVNGEATQYVNIADYLRGNVADLDSIVSWGVDGSGRLYAVGLDGDLFRFTPSVAAGDAGDDMHGGGGNDTMFGGAGDDMLDGGHGSDVLNGGLGADTFLFGSVHDSRPGRSDTIADLTNADAINLHKIDADRTQDGNQDFDLVGSFSHTAGELTLTFDGTNTLLEGDVNGDGITDFRVAVTGDHSGFTNFVL